MKTFGIAVLCLALAAPIGAAMADDDDDDKGRGRGAYSRQYDRHFGGDQRRERKVEYDDGRCKVERKWEKSGEYKEKVECRDGRPGRHQGYGSGGYPGYGYGGYPGYGYGYR